MSTLTGKNYILWLALTLGLFLMSCQNSAPKRQETVSKTTTIRIKNSSSRYNTERDKDSMRERLNNFERPVPLNAPNSTDTFPSRNPTPTSNYIPPSNNNSFPSTNPATVTPVTPVVQNTPIESPPLPAETMPIISSSGPSLIPPPLPRVLVYLKGYKGDEVGTELEEFFTDNQFKLMDRDQLSNIQAVDSALASGDPGKLAFLKNRYGVEVIVTGKVKWRRSARRRIYGRMQDFYRGSITIKAIEADTGEIIYSKGKQIGETGREGKLIQTAKKLAGLFAGKLKQHWAKKKYRGREFNVVLSNASYDNLKSFESYLKKIPKITSGARRSFAKGTAFYTVEFRGQSGELERGLLECPNLSLEIIRTTANRIELKVIH